jgi:hypothetical protein
VRSRPILPLGEDLIRFFFQREASLNTLHPPAEIDREWGLLLAYRVSLHLEVTDAPSLAPAEALSILPNPVPSPLQTGSPAVDLRAADLPTAPPC